ncbi:uncharacterized protein L201_006833 [Kwoniella dendrophila CBS 6074]|uniref:Protein BFR2 n=1 Tax=Kwoniella dendrophila CBS 6074 TaxID=1295534 RepID=A0AAX4K447_9TREE
MSSLAEQLKKLSSSSNTKTLDPESAYTSLDSLPIIEKENPNEGKEHYLDVGPSKLRSKLLDDEQGDENSGGTLRGIKYQGEKVGRQKIFEDDDSEEEEAEGGMAFGNVEDSDEEDEDDDDDDDEDDEDEDEDDEDEDEELDDDEEDEDEEEEDEDEEDEEEEEEVAPKSKSSSSKTLDPMASLRDSRAKDIEKGVGIRRQKALFESLLTLRITFQKALTSSNTLPKSIDHYPLDPEGEIQTKKNELLKSLSELNENLFTIRENLLLPNSSEDQIKLNLDSDNKKRKRDEFDEETYWKQSAEQSLKISDYNHNEMLPILNKWSSKIQAASLQLGSKQAGGSKFLQSVKNGSGGVVEAIEVGLASKRDSEKTLMESEESSYRSLLRQVIESRSGSGPIADLTHLRKEKKKKREAERGGSKGRKLRYTVHEKAQNFVVPIPLSNGWHEEQIDELFSSLFGGVGMSGAKTEKDVQVDIGRLDGDDEGEGESGGLSGLGGLRVF